MLSIMKKSLVVVLSLLVPLFFIDLSMAGKKDSGDDGNTVLGVQFDDGKSGDKGDDKGGDKDDGKSGDKGDDKGGDKDDGKSGDKGGNDDDDDSSNNPGGNDGKDDDDKSSGGSLPGTGGSGSGGGSQGGSGTSAVPEPASVLLLGLGGAAIGIRRLMRKLKK